LNPDFLKDGWAEVHKLQKEKEMSEMTVEKLMERMPGAFLPEKAEGVEAKIQFHLGDEGGDWVVSIHEGKCTTEQGVTEDPKLTITAEAKDYIDIVTGKLNAMTALANQQVSYKGDLNLAMKMMQMFET
jgi:putative sterol carrier protein